MTSVLQNIVIITTAGVKIPAAAVKRSYVLYHRKTFVFGLIRNKCPLYHMIQT